MKKLKNQNTHPFNIFIDGNITVDFFRKNCTQQLNIFEKLHPEVCVPARR